MKWAEELSEVDFTPHADWGFYIRVCSSVSWGIVVGFCFNLNNNNKRPSGLGHAHSTFIATPTVS